MEPALRCGSRVERQLADQLIGGRPMRRIVVAFAALVSSMAAVLVVAMPTAALTTFDLDGSGHRRGIVVHGICVPADSALQSPVRPAVPMKVIFCGRPSSAANGLWNKACGAP